MVKKRRLWPRAIVQPPLTDADTRALVSYARQEERRPEENVHVRIDDRAVVQPVQPDDAELKR